MPPAIITQTITFENSRAATAVLPPANAKAEDIIGALRLADHRAVLLLIGGADNIDEKLKPRLTQLFGRGIARAAVNANAVIIDGATNAGVMEMMGQGVADRGYKTPLIGVAPRDLVTYPGSTGPGKTPLDPNHSHFVLVDGNAWGSETSTIYQLVGALRNKVPAMALLVGGGNVTRSEALQAVRHNLRLLVVEGSGGVADEIAAAWKARPALPDDPVMAEIIADGGMDLHQLGNSVKGAERLVERELGGDNVLLQAWENFAEYDLNAMLLQRKFSRMQTTILIIGVLGTFLTIVSQVWAPKGVVLNRNNPWWWLNHSIIAIPIILTVLLTAAKSFKQGNKWLFLRAGAESIKREIYRYRTRATEYSETNVGYSAGVPVSLSPEERLARKLQDITQTVMETDVSTSVLIPYSKESNFPPYVRFLGDDGFSMLTPDRYVEVRLMDQLNYYKRKTVKLARGLAFYQWLIFIVGEIGTYLAVVNQQVWIAVTTSIVAALTSYLGSSRAEDSLTKFNQAKTELESIRWWWAALAADDQELQQNIDILVEHTEQVLKSELDNWAQLKQKSLAELRRSQTQGAEKERTARKNGSVDGNSGSDSVGENAEL